MILNATSFIALGFRVSSDNADFVTSAIRTAELSIVKYAVGASNYVDMMNATDVTSKPYIAREGNSTMAGLKVAIGHLTFATLLRDNITATRFGAVEKKDEYSQPASESRIETDIMFHEQTGWLYLNEVADYLEIKLDESKKRTL